MAERLSLDWARVDDEGADDAAEAPAVRGPEAVRRDWEGLDARLRDALSGLWASPMVRNDPECRAIFEALLIERGGEALDRAATRLAERVDALTAARVPRARPAPEPPSPPRPASLRRSLFKL